jgi:hypothetical protein
MATLTSERARELGALGTGEKKRQTPEHYERLAALAAEGRAKAAKKDPEWHQRRMRRAWATRRARYG